MDKKEEQLLNQLLALFRVEAREHLKIISSGLIELEKAGPEKQRELVEVIYREAHSLKGAARSVNLSDVAALCQSLEHLFAALKKCELPTSTELFDMLHEAVDMIGSLAAAGEGKKDGEIGELHRRLESLCRMVGEGFEAGYERPGEKVEEPKSQYHGTETKHPVSSSPPLSPNLPSAETIRIATKKLDSLLFQAEELLAVKIASGQRATELGELQDTFGLLKKELQKAGRTEGGSLLTVLDRQLSTLRKAAEYDCRYFGGMVDGLLGEMKKVLMLPISSLLDMFPKFVRDLSRDMGKEVEMTIAGGEIEIDRRILEEMKAPLLHLVRNCVDHGIEKVEDRRLKGKTIPGAIELAVQSRNGGKLEIAVSDDGAGIDQAAVKAAALRQGFLSPEEAEQLADQDVLALMFRSGLTTSPIITDISGRGLGLAIVREKVEKLNGLIAVDARPDRGTTFRMVIPLTLSTFRGVLVNVAGQEYILPATNVERVIRLKKEEIKTVENRPTLLFDGRLLSLARLDDVLGIAQTPGPARNETAEDSFVQIVVVGAAEKRMAFLLKEVLEEREVLVKPLGRQLSRVRNIAAATVLGSGRVVPILNVIDLLKSAVQAAAPPARRAEEESGEMKKSILVVEDSITARTLLKNILHTAGYDVKTAVDGVEAVSALRTYGFDLVVADVQMPRMDGFDLVRNIRGDARLSELPVVLVTSLESPADRQRGIDAGADAYIVKSSFDQGNLLEIIERLI